MRLFSIPKTAARQVTWAVTCTALLSLAPMSAAAQRAARVVLLDSAGDPVPAEDVAAELAERLEAARIDVDVKEPSAWPGTNAQWIDLARGLSRERPGTLLLAGWRCEDGGGPCTLVLVEPERGGTIEFSVAPSETAEARPAAIALTISEALGGGLISELRRLPAGAGVPAPGHPSEEDGADTPVPDAGNGKTPLSLWIEGGYTGEYPYPGDRPIHGPFLGLSMAPSPYVAPTITVGWLGIEQGAGVVGEAATHRIPATLAVRVRFEVGPATFAVAPAGRFDTVFSRVDPAGAGPASSAVDLEIHVGGITTWHLPFPGGLDAVVGAGVLATVLGQDADLDGERLIGRSSVRFLWMAALAWDPRAR